jgi:hypothetical protein
MNHKLPSDNTKQSTILRTRNLSEQQGSNITEYYEYFKSLYDRTTNR